MRQRVLELVEQLGRQAPGCAWVDPADLAILRRLATEPEMASVWQRLQVRATSETALVKFLEAAWHHAMLTPPIQTPHDRVMLAQLFRKEIESLRLTNPELAQSFVPVSVYLDQVAREERSANSPLLVRRRRQPEHDQARAYVRILGALNRELFGRALLGILVTTAQVALRLTIDKRQAQIWMAD